MPRRHSNLINVVVEADKPSCNYTCGGDKSEFSRELLFKVIYIGVLNEILKTFFCVTQHVMLYVPLQL